VLPDALAAVRAIPAAAQGDPAAVAVLRDRGVPALLECLAPGSGAYAQDLVGQVGGAVRGLGALAADVVEGEYRELAPRPPWHRFARWLPRQDWGTVVVAGPMGGGKTWTALRTARILAESLDYPVYGINFWDEDRPPWMTVVSMDQLVRWAKMLKDALAEAEMFDEDRATPAGPADQADPFAKLGRIKNRIILIDEMSLADAGPMSAERKAVKLAMTQGRHLGWWVIYIGQMLEQLPAQLLNGSIFFLKEPAGNEPWMDKGGRNAVIRWYWLQAIEAFKGLRASDWYEHNPDRRAWSYAICKRTVAYGKGYEGLLPNLPPDAPLVAADTAEED
jgi:hypothetical protein